MMLTNEHKEVCKLATCKDVTKAAASGNTQFQYFLKHGKPPTNKASIKKALR